MSPKRRGASESKGRELKPDYDQSWAVVIGIDEYEHFNRLDYAVRDAEGIAELLTTELDFPKANVFCILDPPSTEKGLSYSLVAKKASKENIEGLLFTDLPKKTHRDDRVVVFYAGHGFSRRLPSGRHVGYIVPGEAKTEAWHKYIQMKQVVEESEGCEAKHMFYMLDACFSGLAITRSAAAPSRFETDMLTNRARQVLAAGTAKQVVSDTGPGGHSLFTHSILGGLRGGADVNQDGVVTGYELMTFVRNKVASALGSRQTPVFGDLLGHQSGADFVFRKMPSKEETRVRRALPAQGGDSIGHVASTAGTLGCLVQSEYHLYILSSSSVLDPGGAAKAGDHILHPGPFDGGVPSRDVIAFFERSVPRLGAALARVLNAHLVDHSLRIIGRLRGVVEPKRGMKLRMFGRTSGSKRVVVEAVNVSAAITISHSEVRNYRNLFMATPGLEGGDSGAVLVDEKNRGVGLAFAGTSERLFAVPLVSILDALKVSLVCGDD